MSDGQPWKFQPKAVPPFMEGNPIHTHERSSMNENELIQWFGPRKATLIIEALASGQQTSINKLRSEIGPIVRNRFHTL